VTGQAQPKTDGSGKGKKRKLPNEEAAKEEEEEDLGGKCSFKGVSVAWYGSFLVITFEYGNGGHGGGVFLDEDELGPWGPVREPQIETDAQAGTLTEEQRKYRLVSAMHALL